jgi:hypothetical protein
MDAQLIAGARWSLNHDGRALTSANIGHHRKPLPQRRFAADVPISPAPKILDFQGYST